MWVDPGPLTKATLLFALPAFVVGMSIVRLLGHFGADEFVVFMITLPITISLWFYLFGWLLDRRRNRRFARKQ